MLREAEFKNLQGIVTTSNRFCSRTKGSHSRFMVGLTENFKSWSLRLSASIAHITSNVITHKANLVNISCNSLLFDVGLPSSHQLWAQKLQYGNLFMEKINYNFYHFAILLLQSVALLSRKFEVLNNEINQLTINRLTTGQS